MAKELLLYSGIYSFVAGSLINSIEEAKRQNIKMRINSGGGEVQATWGLAAKIQEHGDVTLLVDGVAASSAANLTMYAKSVECLDVSTFVFHRAAFPYGGESPEEKAFLSKVNNDLRLKMEAKIDSNKMKAMKGISVAELFEGEERKFIMLNADEAKQLGIVQKVNKVDPTQIESFNASMLRIAAEYKPDEKTQNQNTMTLAELKTNHPSLYAEIFNLGKVEGCTEGIAKERDRVGAVMVFANIDPKGVQEIIKSGQAMTQTQMAEFSLKALSPEVLAKIKKESETTVVKTDEVPGTKPENQELEGFEKKLRADMGLDKNTTEVKVNGGIALIQEKTPLTVAK
jgi:ATP-dependent protease ClpP protease subunit